MLNKQNQNYNIGTKEKEEERKPGKFGNKADSSECKTSDAKHPHAKPQKFTGTKSKDREGSDMAEEDDECCKDV